MFAAPKCVLGGEIPAPAPFSDVYCDPRGAVWTVDVSGTKVYYYAVTDIETLMANYSLTNSNGNEVKPEPVYECEHNDHVLSIVFPSACNVEGRFVCIATAEGHLILGNADSPSDGLLQSALGMELTAVLAVSESDGAPEGAGVLVSRFDGIFSEVVFVRCSAWPAACAAACSSASVSSLPTDNAHRDDKHAKRNKNSNVGGDNVATRCAVKLDMAKEESDDEDEDEDSEVVSAALFRIRGRLQSLMLDETGAHVVTVAQNGNVDVWNWCQGVDETSAMGMPSYRADEHGEPVCATLLFGDRLWIGTDAGAIVVFALHHGTDAEASGPVRVWPAHEGSVHSLLTMSFGRSVWSCGADGQARVWDAGRLALLGSFAFPGGGLAALSGGSAALDATLWALDAATGAATWLTVREAVPCGRAPFAAHAARETVAAHEAFTAHLCALLEAAKPSPSPSPSLDAALRAVADSVPGARALPGAVAAAASASRAIRRALTDDGAPSRSLVEDVQVLLRDRRSERARDAEFRRGLEEIARIVPGACAVESMDDVIDAVRRLAAADSNGPKGYGDPNGPKGYGDPNGPKGYGDPNGPRGYGGPNGPKGYGDPNGPKGYGDPNGPKGYGDPNGPKGYGDSNGPSAAAAPRLSGSPPCPDPNTGPKSPAMLSLESSEESDAAKARRFSSELAAERRAHAEASQQLTDADEERRELLRRVEQATARQEEDERRIAALERALAAARRAASITAADASQLSEMEARLAEAKSTIAALQSRAEDHVRERKGSTRDAAEAHAELARFAAKEQLAHRAFVDFIVTENGIMDRVEELRRAESMTAARVGVEALYVWFCKRIEAQRAFHAALKQSFAAHYGVATRVAKDKVKDELIDEAVIETEKEDDDDDEEESAVDYEEDTIVDEVELQEEEEEEEDETLL